MGSMDLESTETSDDTPSLHHHHNQPINIPNPIRNGTGNARSIPNPPTIRNRKNRSKIRNSHHYIPKLKLKLKLKPACLRSPMEEEQEPPATTSTSSFDMEAVKVNGGDEPKPDPTHLVVMVNGLIGSADNWRFAAKQFVKKYPNDLIVHCSESNPARLTFDGVDVMGDRLAEEVISVIKRHPNVQRISVIGHSLGGLVARYAIARLYEKDISSESQQTEDHRDDGSGSECLAEKLKNKIAGLEPVNFITSASPHLGSRGHKQVPAFCGFSTLEKLAVRTSWCLGRTGKHLFLTDTDKGKKPLLLQMVKDTKDLKFISALKSFKRRVVYANASFDHLVGWSTSSLRHPDELPKHKCISRDKKYPHIVSEEQAEFSSTQGDVLSEEEDDKTTEMEDVMLRSLTRLSWERVDVSFSGSTQRLLAHSTIQVKTYCINSDGEDVIQHMVDNFLLS